MALTNEEKVKRNETLSNLSVNTHKDSQDYVFISYKSDDWEAVFTQVVFPLVEQYGLRVYCDKAFDSDNKNWLEQMKLNIESRHCRAILVFLSKSYLSSYATMLELMYNRFNINVLHSQKFPPVIPICLDNSEQWDDYFRGANTRLTGMPGEGFEREAFVELCDGINDYIEECNGVGISKGLKRLMKQVEKEKGLSFDVHQLFCYYMMQEMLSLSGATHMNDWFAVKDLAALKNTIQSAVESNQTKGHEESTVFSKPFTESAVVPPSTDAVKSLPTLITETSTLEMPPQTASAPPPYQGSPQQTPMATAEPMGFQPAPAPQKNSNTFLLGAVAAVAICAGLFFFMGGDKKDSNTGSSENSATDAQATIPLPEESPADTYVPVTPPEAEPEPSPEVEVVGYHGTNTKEGFELYLDEYYALYLEVGVVYDCDNLCVDYSEPEQSWLISELQYSIAGFSDLYDMVLPSEMQSAHQRYLDAEKSYFQSWLVCEQLWYDITYVDGYDTPEANDDLDGKWAYLDELWDEVLDSYDSWWDATEKYLDYDYLLNLEETYFDDSYEYAQTLAEKAGVLQL